MNNMKTFTEKVLEVVAHIPRGQVLSYQQVAEKSGSPKAFRVVGTILKNNTNVKIPCHRVIKSDGSFGEYNGLQGKSKEEVLFKEGYRVSDKKK